MNLLAASRPCNIPPSDNAKLKSNDLKVTYGYFYLRYVNVYKSYNHIRCLS